MSEKALKTIAGAPDKPLIIGDIEIPCYVLEDETRVLSQSGLQASIGMSKSGGGGGGGTHRVGALVRKISYLSHKYNTLTARIETPIEFQPPKGGRTAYGYEATILADICELILDAELQGLLLTSQAHLAQRCRILVSGFAKIGIIGLVDECTGYQKIREQNALAKILERYIEKEWQAWTKTFPDEFYEQIFRLRGWGSVDGISRPSVIGRYTNDFVYQRLAPGILDELREKTPILPRGSRKRTHHQWFTPDYGHPKLKEHLAAVIALMKAAPNWVSFNRLLERAFPKLGDQGSLDSGDDDDC